MITIGNKNHVAKIIKLFYTQFTIYELHNFFARIENKMSIIGQIYK